MTRRLVLIFVMALGLVNTAQADIIFRVGDVTVVPGQQAKVGIYVSATAGETLDAYDLPIDVGNDGFGAPAFLTIAPAPADIAEEVGTFSNVVITRREENAPFVHNYEGLFSDGGSAMNLSTEVHLFDLLVDTSAGFSGTTPVAITTGSGFPNVNFFNVVASSGTFDGVGTGVTVVTGSISAVPEPASLAVLMPITLLAFGRRRKA